MRHFIVVIITDVNGLEIERFCVATDGADDEVAVAKVKRRIAKKIDVWWPALEEYPGYQKTSVVVDN